MCNTLLDKGFFIPASNGSLVPLLKTDFAEIMENDSQEYRIFHKLTAKHVHCKVSEQWQVHLAAQSLSHSTVIVFPFLVQVHQNDQRQELDPQGVIEMKAGAKAKQDAEQRMNNWCDIMNSRQMLHTHMLSCGLGVHYHEQFASLDEMEQFLKDFKITGKTTELPWQIGIHIAINPT